ncbi:hypothetical protein ACP70R_031527 [Stipagrostis hirtigluma subsp. patula]
MGAFQGPGSSTASICRAVTAQGTHSFKIANYSLHRGLGVGKYISSATFTIGGYDWCIEYYPDLGSGGVAVRLQLMTKKSKVRALVKFSLVDQCGGASPYGFPRRESASVSTEFGYIVTLMSFTELESSPYLQDDCIVIQCAVTVIKEPRVVETVVAPEIRVPPSSLLDNLGKLLETGDGADVTFQVKGEVFPAHKILLAMQSPVFNAELYGPMRDTRGQHITIEDMEPAVFKALLRFIYTDSMPTMDDLEADVKEDMIKHLLIAADRYGVERMKLMCESILCKGLDAASVATTLALADQHHCSNLKDACIEFISSLDRMDDVVSSQGYEHLKRSCPAVLAEVFERATKSRKI